MKREEVKYITKIVKGIKMKYPINYYIKEESYEKEILKKIKSGEIKTPEQYLNYQNNICSQGYTEWFKNYFEEGGFQHTEEASRRSLTDILGTYLTYFPTRNTTAGVWRFVKAFVKFANSNGIHGHFCTDPQKVVFHKPHYNDTEVKVKYEGIPLTSLTEIMWAEGNTEEICIEEIGEEIYTPDYDYMMVDPDDEGNDLISPNGMKELFEKTL